MTRRRELDRSFHINDWCSAARPRRSAATEGHVSCNVRVGLPSRPPPTRGCGFQCSQTRDDFTSNLVSSQSSSPTRLGPAALRSSRRCLRPIRRKPRRLPFWLESGRRSAQTLQHPDSRAQPSSIASSQPPSRTVDGARGSRSKELPPIATRSRSAGRTPSSTMTTGTPSSRRSPPTWRWRSYDLPLESTAYHLLPKQPEPRPPAARPTKRPDTAAIQSRWQRQGATTRDD